MNNIDYGNFDYQQIDEQPDEPDFNRLKPCPHCKKPIPADSTMCLYCGEEVDFFPKKKSAAAAWITAAVIIGLLLWLFLSR